MGEDRIGVEIKDKAGNPVIYFMIRKILSPLVVV